MVEVTYIVEVTREGSNWLADVKDLPGAHTFAGNIPALDENVRDVLALVLDVDPQDLPEYRYRFLNVSESFERAVQIGRERADVEAEARRLKMEAVVAVQKLTDDGWSVRDTAGALRMSPGRVSQILATINEGDRARQRA